MKNKSIDMLHAPLLPSILRFSVPLILSSVLQLLFNAADLMVVGNWSDNQNAVGAISSTGALINLIVNLFIGLSIGAGVAVSHGIGSSDDEAVSKVVHTSMPTAVIGGILMTIVGIIFAEPLLVLMDTPADLLEKSTLYMQLYFLGITFSMVYNFAASILRAVGDTKGPLIYLAISGVVNFLLNLYFVLVHNMDVDGVAIATSISQLVSAVLVVIALMKRTDCCQFRFRKCCMDWNALKKVISIGLPAGIQNSLFSISNVILQTGMNSFNNAALNTGNGAAGNIEGFQFVAMNSIQLSAMNFIGQNHGARNYKRIKDIYRICLAIVTVIGLSVGVIFTLFRDPLVRLYIPESEEAIAFATERMVWICMLYFICGMMNVSTGSLRGIGISTSPMVTSILGVCVFRALWIYTIFQIPALHTPVVLYLSYPVSWLLTFLPQHISFKRHLKKLLKMQTV